MVQLIKGLLCKYRNLKRIFRNTHTHTQEKKKKEKKKPVGYHMAAYFCVGEEEGRAFELLYLLSSRPMRT